MTTYCLKGCCDCRLLFLYRWRLRMIKQREEALSPKNVYYFGICYNREPKDEEELIVYYVEHGGASGFAKRESGHTANQN